SAHAGDPGDRAGRIGHVSGIMQGHVSPGLAPVTAAPCTCGQRHQVSPAEVWIAPGALAASAERLVGSPVVWVLSDDNTERAAAARWKSRARAGRIVERVLPGDPRPVPSIELADELAREVRAVAPDLLVAIGGGVISDLVKKVSLETRVPSWAVATAPSVDAYRARTAALRIGGFHQAVPARPADAIICDLEVLAAAPRPLILAGLGDLLAKLYARLDWPLAHLVAGEPYCELIADAAAAAARGALEAAADLDRDPLTALAALTRALVVSGCAMQAWGSSRPAASAEHTVAHFWETTTRTAGAPAGLGDLHGLLVGAASAAILPGYHAFHAGLADTGPAIAARLAAFDAEPPVAAALAAVTDDALRAQLVGPIARETPGGRIDRRTLEDRLRAFAAAPDRVAAIAPPLLAEVAGAVSVLAGLGFPFTPEALGVSLDAWRAPMRWVRLLRRRYTTFDLAYELGREPALLTPILGA
ncbi:MAG: iron-containing alcohol dehydrogenase, partial [Kofleriaceae bacterium]